MHRIGIAGLLGSILALGAFGGCAPSPSSGPPTLSPTAPPIEPTTGGGNPNVIQSAWGPIWDTVPPQFLVFAGAQPVEIDEPVSAALDHPAEAASPDDIVQAYVTDLGISGWKTTLDGPSEDGSIAVDAEREGTACRAQVKATPLGGVVRITILYGADCERP